MPNRRRVRHPSSSRGRTNPYGLDNATVSFLRSLTDEDHIIHCLTKIDWHPEYKGLLDIQLSEHLLEEARRDVTYARRVRDAVGHLNSDDFTSEGVALLQQDASVMRQLTDRWGPYHGPLWHAVDNAQLGKSDPMPEYWLDVDPHRLRTRKTAHIAMDDVVMRVTTPAERSRQQFAMYLRASPMRNLRLNTWEAITGKGRRVSQRIEERQEAARERGEELGLLPVRGGRFED